MHCKERRTMSASLTSGTYGHQPIFTGALRQLVTALFASRPVATTTRFANSFRVRVREANDVRELARSVEMHSPGFAADLYAAASRHEGIED
jgi:hypothetical protein